MCITRADKEIDVSVCGRGCVRVRVCVCVRSCVHFLIIISIMSLISQLKGIHTVSKKIEIRPGTKE